MPVNAEGQGPEQDPDKVVDTLHEVWDTWDGYRCVGYGSSADNARWLVDQLNRPNLLQDIIDFHDKFGQSYNGKTRMLPTDLHKFRVGFMQEELDEYQKEQVTIYRRTPIAALANQLDALIDLIYVTLGTAHYQGFAKLFYAAWNRVHRANMAKVKANPEGDDRSKRNAVFDIVKPAGWKAPDHTDLVTYGLSLPDEE